MPVFADQSDGHCGEFLIIDVDDPAGGVAGTRCADENAQVESEAGLEIVSARPLRSRQIQARASEDSERC